MDEGLLHKRIKEVLTLKLESGVAVDIPAHNSFEKVLEIVEEMRKECPLTQDEQKIYHISKQKIIELVEWFDKWLGDSE